MINITRRFRDAVLKVANGISPGGATNLMSKVTVTVVNPTENDIAIKPLGVYELKDGMLICDVRHMIKAGESEVIEYYVGGDTSYDNFYDGTGETVFYSAGDMWGMDALNRPYVGMPSNLVNIGEDFNIIDLTKPASFTATLTED